MTSWHLTGPTQTLRSKFHGEEVCTSRQIWNAFKTYGAPRLAACEELKVHTVHRGRHWKAITTVARTGATGHWWRPDEDQWDAVCRGVTCYGKLSVTDELHYPTDCSPCYDLSGSFTRTSGCHRLVFLHAQQLLGHDYYLGIRPGVNKFPPPKKNLHILGTRRVINVTFTL
jgi:hypothetical protein